jgi:hypothetical protein
MVGPLGIWYTGMVESKMFLDFGEHFCFALSWQSFSNEKFLRILANDPKSCGQGNIHIRHSRISPGISFGSSARR